MMLQPHHLSGPHKGPPPICFNCSGEHLLVDCPMSQRRNVGGPPQPVAAQPNYSTGHYAENQGPSVAAQPHYSNGHYPARHTPQRFNTWNAGGPGALTSQFIPPVVTRYAVPSIIPQYENGNSAYGPSPTALSHQSNAAPSYQSYPPQSQSPYPPQPPPQQYGVPVVSPYSQSPASHSYSLAPDTQYGQRYQEPPNAQYHPRNETPQYNGAEPHQYASPSPVQYQSPTTQYPSRSNSYSVPPPPQWNKTALVPASSPFGTPAQQQGPYQQPENFSIPRAFSETSSQVYQSQPTPQQEQAQVYEVVQTPETPASTHSVNEEAEMPPNSSADESHIPPESATESLPSTRASTPYGRYGFFSSTAGQHERASTAAESHSATSASITGSEPGSLVGEAKVKRGASSPADRKGKKDAEEEGELTAEDLAQETFNWEYKKIFLEPRPTESVALSQPLSSSFNVTPVPLLDRRSTASVSRYARKDNLKEYLRPIRELSQWDYLKEDPAFSNAELIGALIPLSQVRSWMDKRHGIEPVIKFLEEEIEEAKEVGPKEMPESSPIRKRAWTDEQQDVDDQIQLEDSIEQNEPSSKRQKNENQMDDCLIIPTFGRSAPGTPVLGRSGTPTFGDIKDDVWAPEPGEAASAPMDPTEALLASLGVSGSPKPVRQQSIQIGEDCDMEDYSEYAPSMSPQIQHSESNMTAQGSSQANDYVNQQYNAPPQSNGFAPSQPNMPYSNHGIPVYSNDVPPQPNPAPSYGSPQQQGAFSQPPFNNNHYGPPQVQYPQQQYGQPQPQYPPHGQYGPPQAQYNGAPQFNGPPQNQYPVQGQYGLPHNQYAPPPQQQQYNGVPQWNVPPQAQHPYGPPQGAYAALQAQYNGPPPGQYVPPQGLPQNQWGPQQGQYNNGYAAKQGLGQQFGNPGYGPPQGPPMQGNPSHVIGLQQVNQQAFQNNHQGQVNRPRREDSGYASARGSYSNGSAYNEPAVQSFVNGGQPVPPKQQTNGGDKAKLNGDGGNDTPSPDVLPAKKKSEEILDHESPKDGALVESPLSPTSAEILGKLVEPSKPRKIIRVISGKKRDEGDSPVKKSKRPPPVVAEAFSRRW